MSPEGNAGTTAMKRHTIREIIVRAAPGDIRRALVQAGHLTFRAALGRSGRTSRKREGDGATPIGAMRLMYGYVRRDRLSGLLRARLPLVSIDATMLWCDAPENASYNRPVRAPFGASHEEMKRKDGLYDICLVMDWNITSRGRNVGSAIFFHCARPGYPPTQGCIAIDIRDMRRLLPLIGPETVVRVL
jgi:L,D-peptidoglycan transpeptidase YkuD (ErfK/YbiS/YcfS/YnhG family)